MTTFDRSTKYFRGNGVVMVAERDAAGRPKGFIAQGNCSALGLTHEVSVIEKKESQSGQNSVDKRIETEKTVTLSMTLDNHAADVIKLALRADVTAKKAGSVTGEALKLYNGKIMPFANIKVSAVAVKRGATALTAYVDDATPYDYKLNAEAGSIQFNDGSVAAIDKLTTGGTAPTAITVGATTTVTVANTANAGEHVAFTGFTGADAALINGKAHKILSATPAQVVIDLDTTGKTITLGTPLSAFDGIALTADYSYAAQNRIDAMTTGAPERYLRFEGLNTAEENIPVVVEAFRFQVDPGKEFGLIQEGDNLSSFVLEGSVLFDALQSSGSKYYKVTQTI